MGFSVRKRTKGKGLWLNGSVSSRGPHASVSTKFGKDLTLNNSGRGSRVTVNFGGGLRWIKSSSTRRVKDVNTDVGVETPREWAEIKTHVYKRIAFFAILFLVFFLISWMVNT